MSAFDVNEAINQFAYSNLTSSFSAGGVTWSVYNHPPKDGSSAYVWFSSSIVGDEGTKDGYIFNVNLEVTVVHRMDEVFINEDALNAAAHHIKTQLGARLTKAVILDWNIFSSRLKDNILLKEFEGENTTLVRKLNFRILAEEL